MSELLLPSECQMARIQPLPRADNRRVISGIIYVIEDGLQWTDAPKAYGPHKTLYNRFVALETARRVYRIFVAPAAEGAQPERIMIDATPLKAHQQAHYGNQRERRG